MDQDEMNKVKMNTKSKVAEKAATAVGGPVAGKSVGALAKTKMGDAALAAGSKPLGKTPMGPSALRNNAQNNTDGNKGASDGKSSGASSSSGKSSPNGSGSAPNKSGDAPNSSMKLGSDNDDENSGVSSSAKSKIKDKIFGSSSDSKVSGILSNPAIRKKILIACGPAVGYFFLVLICIIGVLAFILGPADTVVQFFKEKWEDLKTLVGYRDEEYWETQYYKKLDEVQEYINQEYGVCIDINLVTATLSVDMGTDDHIEEGTNEEFEFDESELGEEAYSKDKYKRMYKQIELLSNMQIRRSIYGFDKRVKEKNDKKTAGVILQELTTHYNKPIDELVAKDGNYCAIEEDKYPVGDNENEWFDITPAKNSYSFGKVFRNILEKGSLYFQAIPIRNSSTSRNVAANDLETGLWTFLSKKANQERNIEYMFYVPAYEIKEYTKGDDTVGYKAYCNTELPDGENAKNDFARFDVGSLNEMEDNVYYWNLVDQFIDKYYQDYLSQWEEGSMIPTEEEGYKKIKNIISDIYLLYNEMGESRECEATKFLCSTDEGGEYYGSASRKEFGEKIAEMAIEASKVSGVKASVIIAQAALESANGNSKLSEVYRNYFGYTAGSCIKLGDPAKYKGTVLSPGDSGNECSGNKYWDGTVVAMCNGSGEDCQWYRVYDSLLNSLNDHNQLFIGTNCNVGTYEEQIQCAKDHGYATDPDYVKKIIGMIRDNGFDEYDIDSDSDSDSFDIDSSVDDAREKARICYSNGSQSGDFDNWKQNNGPWSGIEIVPGKTIGSVGCAMTSVAIQIMRSGVATTLGSNFNPGTFCEALKSIGGFDSAGNIYWKTVSNIAPNFVYVNMFPASLASITSYVNQGYYIILQVKNGHHWVAVTDVVGDKIYMDDPGSGGSEVGETYGKSSIGRMAVYKVG